MNSRLKPIFLATLLAAPWLTAQAQTITRGPYLQIGSTTALTVKWRTDASTDSVVRYGTSSSSLATTAVSATSSTNHEVRLTGLTPNTKYFYSVGSSSATLVSGSSYYFVTAPTSAKPTRIWVIGDAGTADANQRAVRDAYYNFTGTRETDLWLMLGDNAYQDGTDSEYQSAVFDIYPTLLRKSVLWPTLGNHDAHSASSSSQSGPYYSIFTLPRNAEAGGVASGTEAYYSYDYGNIHFICLNSMDVSRSPSGAMLNWLKLDIADTSKDWIIAFWHHPPYSKGSHDSDLEMELQDMRQNALPILEANGVDLVLCGHSHAYERSYFLNGHYGTSTTLTSAMKVNGGNGRTNGNGAYTKAGNNVANKGAVYVVAGSSGEIAGGLLNHPAMFISLNQLGSVVIDIDGNRLDAKFVRSTGAVADYFTMIKSPSTPPAPTGLAAVVGSSQVRLNWTASSGATSYNVKRSTSSSGPFNTVGTATSLSYTNTSLVNGTTYYFAVSAVNAGGESTNSSIVNATPMAPPAVPTGLGAVAGNGQVRLNWTASSGATSYNVKRSTSSSGPFNTVGTATSPSCTNASLVNGTTYYFAVSAVNAGGESTNSSVVNATPMAPPAVPTGLGAVAGNGQVRLNWTASSGATSYNVKRSTSSSGPFITIGAATSPSYTNTSLINGTTYYFVVSAVNAGAESANSSIVNATPMAPPAVPTGVGAVAGNGQVRLNWTASSGATSYNVKRSTNSSGPFSTIGAATSPSYTNTSLINGTTYYFAVSAVNIIGESANSNPASATPDGIRLALRLDASRRPVLSWNSTPGKKYRVAYKARVTDAAWTNLSNNINANTSTTTWTDTSANSTGVRYYIVYAVN